MFNNIALEQQMFPEPRQTRLRDKMFPDFEIETDYDDGQAPSTSFFADILGEPAWQLERAVVELLGLVGDGGVDGYVMTIPDLIDSLSDSDQRSVNTAVYNLYLMSKEDEHLATLVLNPDLVEALLRAANLSDDPDIKRMVAAVISHLSSRQEGSRQIFRSGGIPQLVRMLGWKIEAVVHYAVTTLHNLLQYVSDSKGQILEYQGLEALIPHLNPKNVRPNVKCQAKVADSIYLLVLDRRECKEIFLEYDGPSDLIEILQTKCGYPLLYASVIRVIRSISTLEANKIYLINKGALACLHAHLKITVDPKRKITILQAMRNLSDKAADIESLNDLIADLLALIKGSTHEEIVSCACGILSNLTCNNRKNKLSVCANNGVPLLAKILQTFPNIEDITEPILCTLRHCTARHRDAGKAQEDIRTNHALPLILSLLATRRAPIVKAALGLLRNCALNEVNMEMMLGERTVNEESVLSITTDVLERSGHQLKLNFEAREDGVDQIEMVEGSVSALHQFATNRDVAVTLLDHSHIMRLLVELVQNPQINNHEDPLLMRELLGIFYQLTKSPEGARIVQGYGATGVFADAIRSQNEAISTYAAAILKNLENDVNEYGDHRGYQRASLAPNFSDYAGWGNDGLEPELFQEHYHSSSITDVRTGHMNNQARGTWCDTDL
uniref:Armadillo segment polarity protein n=1 Tax=Rhabditophanes sp. KR3021 TaxID=114890 RepID=A0AC35TZ30_9BILA